MKRIFAILMVSLFMVAVMAVTASVAFATPKAGNSGHPPGSATECKKDGNVPDKCPGPG